MIRPHLFPTIRRPGGPDPPRPVRPSIRDDHLERVDRLTIEILVELSNQQSARFRASSAPTSAHRLVRARATTKSQASLNGERTSDR
jgi:hypothetical protein